MRLNIDHSWVELGDGHIVSYHPYINIKNQTGVGYIKEFLMITDPEMSAGFYEKKIYEPIAVTEIKEGNPIIVFPDGQRLGLMLSPSQISYFSKLTSRTTTKETNHAR